MPYSTASLSGKESERRREGARGEGRKGDFKKGRTSADREGQGDAEKEKRCKRGMEEREGAKAKEGEQNKVNQFNDP